MTQSVSVLIPVFNNAETLGELYQRIATTLDAAGRQFEIVFVNDGSTDASRAELRALAAADDRCVVLDLSRNFGQHPAISAGLARARGDITVLMDADLQDRPEEMPRLLETLDQNPELDIVYTTFELRDGGKSRLTSRLFHAVFAKLSDVHIPRNLGTYRAFTATVRDALLDYPERSAVYGPLMAKMGFESTYVNVLRDPAAGGRSSYNFRRRLALAMSSIISYGSFLHRFVTWIGLSLTIFSGGYLVTLIIQYIGGYRVLVNGQLLLLAITVLMSGVLLMTVGILSAYTFRIYDEVLARPRYHIAREHGRGLPPTR